MLSGLIFRLSRQRRRFMRELARPGLMRIAERANQVGSPEALRFVTTLNDANADFLAYAFSAEGFFAAWRGAATPEAIEACLGDLLVYCVNLFARDDFARDGSELVGLLAHALAIAPERVMLKRDSFRKAPRSEEWMLYTWLVRDLGGGKPAYDAELERNFGYNYVSYIGQYRKILGRELGRVASMRRMS
jgi:hypothetical protein